MTNDHGLQSVHIRIVKKYRFPEPVFFPKNLHKKHWFQLLDRQYDARFLSDPEQITKLINSGASINLDENTILKRIRNPNIREEIFWKIFKPDEAPVKLVSGALPMFPFQILFKNNHLTISKEYLEQCMSATFEDLKIDLQGRIYPPGIITLQISFYIAMPERTLLPSQVVNVCENINKLPLSLEIGKQKISSKGPFNLFDVIIKRIIILLLNVEQTDNREIPGYYIYFNFQGKCPNWDEYVKDLVRLLAGKQKIEKDIFDQLSKKVENGITNARRNNDIQIIDKRAAICYVDDGIREKYSIQEKGRLLEGRRCFRNKFEGVIDMAYVNSSLIDDFSAKFKDMLSNLNAASLSTKIKELFVQYTTFGVLSPVAYLTLTNSILQLQEKLEISHDVLWKQVYIEAAKELEIPTKIRELLPIVDNLYEQSRKWTDEHNEKALGVLKYTIETTLQAFTK